MTGGSRGSVAHFMIGLACLVGGLFLLALVAFGSGAFRNFSVPAEGMAPTLETGDRFVARMDGASNPKRGEILIFSVGESTYIQRVAAVAGDTIGMRDGVVILNGRPVAQRFLNEETRRGLYGTVRARRLAEQFPGETAEHQILDQGPSPLDQLAEMRIPPGFLFMLGDNRDMAADSRVAHEAMGVELLPLADVRGRPLVRIWPSSKAGDRVR